jgi:hypothetical protein
MSFNASQSIKQDPISKVIKAKGTVIEAQAVEHLPSKCKALSSTLGIQKLILKWVL